MSDLRESRLLARIAREGAALQARAAHVRLGPGDDMALIELAGRNLLAAVDQVIEGRHFVAGTDDALVARKAIARNLSDVAAMAAKPVATLAACVLPASWDEARAERLFEALMRQANEWECPLIGGDTAVHAGAARDGDRSAPLILTVTILAEPWPEALESTGADAAMRSIVRRRAAQAGDGVFVTGLVGGSFGPDGLGPHLHFEPRVHEARALRRALGDRLHSMIDVSDGLGRDAAALVDEGVQVVLDAASLPCRPACDWRRALGDGEDHELCFAATGDVPASLPSRDGSPTPVTRIGEVRTRSRAPACVVTVDGGELDASHFGWEHGADERR